MNRIAAALSLVVAALVAACGGGAAPGAATRTPSLASTIEPARTAPAASATPPLIAATATGTAAAPPPGTPPPGEQTGVLGTVTLGPTCPVQRADSPCADRPYAARVSAWRGGVQVAATTAGADGRFVLLLPPGDYRIVGESAGAFPRGETLDVTVAAGRLTSVTLRYDTGIR